MTLFRLFLAVALLSCGEITAIDFGKRFGIVGYVLGFLLGFGLTYMLAWAFLLARLFLFFPLPRCRPEGVKRNETFSRS